MEGHTAANRKRKQYHQQQQRTSEVVPVRRRHLPRPRGRHVEARRAPKLASPWTRDHLCSESIDW
eukprot:10240706-Heterocapsa_arctica.AAC.1